MYDVEVLTSATAIGAASAMLPMAYDAPPAAKTLRGRQGRLPRAVGIRGGGDDGRGAGAGHPHQQRRRRVHAERATLSDRHGGDPQRRQCRRPARAPHRARHQARRRGRADRHHVRGRGHLDRQQPGAGAEGAARAAGVGHADPDAVGRLDALHPRAPLRPGGDDGARVVARPGQPRRLRRAGPALGQLRRRDQRRAARPPEGVDPRRRHADHAGRGDALGDGRERRPARHEAAAEERQPRSARRHEGARHADDRWRQRRRQARGGRGGVSEARGRRGRGQAGGGRSTGQASGRCRGLRLRQGHPARSRAARLAARRHPARHHRHRALAVGRPGRRDAGDDRRRSRVRAAQAEQRAQRRHLSEEGSPDCLGADLAREPGPAGAEGLRDAPADRAGTRDSLRRRRQLSGLQRRHDAAVHERGPARTRLSRFGTVRTF